MELNHSFGVWVRRRRKALDLTQQQLAQRVGCSPSAIFKIESDERRPSRQVAELLAEHLEIFGDQRDQFLKVARQEKGVQHLDSLPPPSSIGLEPAPDSNRTYSNLPLPLTSLIGRDNEMRAVIQQMQDPGCRLLTLIGPGGVGKTRLALEAAQEQRESFDHGVYFVPLVATGAPEYILPAIAAAIGFGFSGANEPKEQLINFLGGKRILLVLDNLEHLLNGIELLDDLLERAPGVKLLTTSREQLNLRAEWTIEVQGLPIPSIIEMDILDSNSAAVLFLQRARQVKMNFTPAPEDVQAIIRICQLVDGLPLGLELAATWLNILSCREIAAEIEHGLGFLETSRRDVPERHRSIRAVFDYSWNLLSTEEQVVLMKLSVFQGGFRREAAEQVAGASLPLLSSLVGKSFVRRNDSGRYDQHELVRQFAASQLQSATLEHARIEDRFGTYYAELLERWEGEIRGPRQLEIIAEMGAEIDNLRLAWNWMIEHDQISNIGKSLPSLWHFHEIRGWFQEGEALFGQAAAALEKSPESQRVINTERELMLGRVLGKKGYFSAQLGRYQEASALMQQSLNMLRSMNDLSGLADTLILLTYMKYRLGEFEAASQHARESLDLNRAMNNQVGIAYCFINLSYVYLAQEEYEQAYELSSESLAICRDVLGDPHGTADSLITLSTAARHLGRLAQAKSWAEAGLQISRTLNDRWSIGQNLRQLGLISFELGELGHAETLIQQSVSQFREIGDLTLMAETLIDLGAVTYAAEKFSESKQYLLKALQMAMDTRSVAIALQALVEIAMLELKGERFDLALGLVTQCLQHPSSNQEVKNRAGKLRAELETRLTSQEIEIIQARIGDKTFEVYVQEILK